MILKVILSTFRIKLKLKWLQNYPFHLYLLRTAATSLLYVSQINKYIKVHFDQKYLAAFQMDRHT